LAGAATVPGFDYCGTTSHLAGAATVPGFDYCGMASHLAGAATVPGFDYCGMASHLAGAAAVPGFDYCGVTSRGRCKTVVRNVWGWEFAWEVLCDSGWRGGGREVLEMQRLGTATLPCVKQDRWCHKVPLNFPPTTLWFWGSYLLLPLHILKLRQLYEVTTLYDVTKF
jgi:hypothetical protein